jgi:hypothetical protein
MAEPMIDVFRWIEQTPVSMFMREDFYAYFVALIFHAWGMAFLVGGGMAVSLRTMGVASQARLEKFAGFFPFMWIGAILAVLSGLALLAGYPAKALTNWVFALKFGCLGGGIALVWRIALVYFPIAARNEALPVRARWLGAAAFLLLGAGVVCGKLLLYTNKMLLAS